MANINLNGNGIGARKGLAFPTAGLQVIVYNQTYEEEGTTYYLTSKGIGLPVISGTGLDTIIDFSPLNDARFDKGSYVGNAYGLPETYNFPYVGIYYDDTSEATRYHWKITDFGYAVVLAQSLLVDNMFFLKALATTDTSNVIASWSGLYIYSTALSGNDLSKMKTYIGIQADFYSSELVDNGGFDTDTLWNYIGDWDINSTVAGKAFYLGTNNGEYLTQDIGLINGKIYKIAFDWVVISGGAIRYLSNNGGFVSIGITVGESGTHINEFTANSTNGQIYFFAFGNWSGTIDNVSIKQFFQNYYKS